MCLWACPCARECRYVRKPAVSVLLELELPVVWDTREWVLGTYLGPLQEQCALLTTGPSLQTYCSDFYFSLVNFLFGALWGVVVGCFAGFIKKKSVGSSLPFSPSFIKVLDSLNTWKHSLRVLDWLLFTVILFLAASLAFLPTESIPINCLLFQSHPFTDRIYHRQLCRRRVLEPF